MSQINTRQDAKSTAQPTLLRRLMAFFSRAKSERAASSGRRAVRHDSAGGEGGAVINLAARRERSAPGKRAVKKHRSGLSAVDEKRILDLTARLRRPPADQAAED